MVFHLHRCQSQESLSEVDSLVDYLVHYKNFAVAVHLDRLIAESGLVAVHYNYFAVVDLLIFFGVKDIGVSC